VQAHEAISGDPPSPVDPPSGCRFRTRCPRAQERCAVEVPELRTLGADHSAACHFPVPREEQLAARASAESSTIPHGR
jgi:peptide/nickel transport system ATP-binding protein